MGNLSSYRGNAQPIGSVVRFHKNVNSSLITENGKEYLRAGEFVPYQTKYASAASLGLKLDGNGSYFKPGHGASTLLAGNSNTVRSWLTYIKGAMCVMSQLGTDAEVASGENAVFLWTKVAGDTLDAPAVVVTPALADLGLTRYRYSTNHRLVSQPFYVSGINQWACVLLEAPETTYATSAGGLFNVNVAVSIDGTSWQLAGDLGILSINTADSYLSGLRITAASIDNQVNYAVGTSNSNTNTKTIWMGSGRLTTSGRVSSITRQPAGQVSNTNVPAATSGYVFMAPISPKGLYYYYFEDSTTHSLNIVDDGAVDAFAVPVGTPRMQKTSNGTAAGSALLTSNGTSLFAYVFDTVASNNGITIPDINDLKTYTQYSYPSTTLSAQVAYAAPITGGNYVFCMPASATSVQTYRVSPSAGTSTSLSNGLTDVDLPFAALNLESSSHVFDNHVWLGKSTTDVILNVTNNTTTDFTLSSGTVRLGASASDAISADGTNLLICYGGHNTTVAGAIAKAPTTNLTSRALKYVDSSTNGPAMTSGVFKRLTDPSQTIVMISRGTNQFLSSADNGESWTLRTASGVSIIYDIDYIGTNYVVVGTSTGSTNLAYGTVLGTWTNIAVNTTGTNCRTLFNTGTALILINAAGNAYRSTNGSSWTAQTGTAVNAANCASVVKNGSTIYAFIPSTTSAGKVLRHQSTDDGVSWSAATTVTSLALNASGQVPGKFVSNGGKWYCVPTLGLLNTTDPEVYETIDLLTFTRVPMAINMITAQGHYASLVVNSGTVYLLCSTGTSGTGLTNTGNGLAVYKVNGSTPSFIGTTDGIVEGNEVGYVRIK